MADRRFTDVAEFAMQGPKLIGIITLAMPRTRKRSDDIFDRIKSVAFDEDGQAWGLVERFTRLPDPDQRPPDVSGEVDFDRWVKFDAIPFAEEELVTKAGWFDQGGRRG